MKYTMKKKEPLNTKIWHRWFAWHPVITRQNTITWLSFVCRKQEFWRGGRCWHYSNTDD